jgi:hypothetical protein
VALSGPFHHSPMLKEWSTFSELLSSQLEIMQCFNTQNRVSQRLPMGATAVSPPVRTSPALHCCGQCFLPSWSMHVWWWWWNIREQAAWASIAAGPRLHSPKEGPTACTPAVQYPSASTSGRTHGDGVHKAQGAPAGTRTRGDLAAPNPIVTSQDQRCGGRGSVRCCT